jgi:acyl-CoA reductase-like NAD-dependent aldehyde dehydrogenase
MFKPTPNPPETSGTDSPEALDAEKMKEAADRAFAHYFPPADEKPAKRRKYHLFAVAPDIDDPEAMLANASEDLLSISAIAANLADDVEGTRRSVALAISRLSDGVQLLVERVLDYHEAMAEAKV